MSPSPAVRSTPATSAALCPAAVTPRIVREFSEDLLAFSRFPSACAVYSTTDS